MPAWEIIGLIILVIILLRFVGLGFIFDIIFSLLGGGSSGNDSSGGGFGGGSSGGGGSSSDF